MANLSDELFKRRVFTSINHRNEVQRVFRARAEATYWWEVLPFLVKWDSRSKSNYPGMVEQFLAEKLELTTND